MMFGLNRTGKDSASNNVGSRWLASKSSASRSSALRRRTSRSRKGAGAIVGEHLIFVDDLEVWVITKKRLRNANLRVQPDGRIEVSVPTYYSDKLVEDFVRSKHDWIVQAQHKYEESPMGRAATASPEELKEWRQVVEACTPVLIEQWAPILGVHPTKLAYRKMKSRWGSCQPSTGRICINIVLALYPPECLEYVVVHELCHLLVPGHGAEFKKLMSSVMPDWEKRRALLR